MAKKPIIDIQPIAESRQYVLWRRVSTAKQGESELGLDAQVTIAKTFMGKDPIAVFTDVHTGTKLKECEALWKAIDYCKAHNTVLVIAKTDRCRNAQEALEILDAIGERNLIFCDLPSCDRFILTVMFAMHERTAIIGRINTRLALAERKKQIAEQGGFFSKSGRWCTKLGGRMTDDMSKAQIAGGKVLADRATEWRKRSPLYIWVQLQLAKNRSRKEILEDAAKLYEQNPEQYGTPGGVALSKGILSFWVKEIENAL